MRSPSQIQAMSGISSGEMWCSSTILARCPSNRATTCRICPAATQQARTKAGFSEALQMLAQVDRSAKAATSSTGRML